MIWFTGASILLATAAVALLGQRDRTATVERIGDGLAVGSAACLLVVFALWVLP